MLNILLVLVVLGGLFYIMVYSMSDIMMTMKYGPDWKEGKDREDIELDEKDGDKNEINGSK